MRFIRTGVDALDKQDVKAAHANFVRAQDIVVELLGSLNREAGGDIARQLSGLYDYCYRQLIAANVQKDPTPAREAMGILRDLGTAWQQIANQQRQALAAGDTAAFVAPRARLAAIAV